jgi:hypothetical protein
MNTKLFTPHAYKCERCGWRVPMEYIRGALGGYVTNKSLREFHAVATTRLIGGDKIVSTCNTCRAVVTKAVA